MDIGTCADPKILLKSGGCPAGWSYYWGTRKCYKHDTTKRSWNDALTFCQNSASNLSSTLASVHDLETNLFIRDLGLTGEGDDAWLGGSQDKQDNWSWDDNTVFGDYTNWGWSEPNNAGGNEDHLAMKFKFGTGLWTDFNGLTSDTGAICQCDSTVTLTAGTDIDLEVLSVPDDLILTTATEFCGKPGKK